MTLPAGAVVEIAACRVVRLWAPTLDQAQAGARCVAELVDGSRLACAEMPSALLGGGEGRARGADPPE